MSHCGAYDPWCDEREPIDWRYSGQLAKPGLEGRIQTVLNGLGRGAVAISKQSIQSGPDRDVIFRVRKKPTPENPDPRPIIEVTKPPRKKLGRKKPRSAIEPGRVIGPDFDFLTGGKGSIVHKAIAKVEPSRTPIQEPDVSIHVGLLKQLSKAGLSKSVRSTIVSGVSSKFGAALAGRVLPAIGRVMTSPAASAGGVGLATGQFLGGLGAGASLLGACPSGFHLAKDGSGRCVRNRRMNFGNARAARRSVRRLKGARKLLRDIEKMMPSKTRARRAPAGHSAHLHHTGG